MDAIHSHTHFPFHSLAFYSGTKTEDVVIGHDREANPVLRQAPKRQAMSPEVLHIGLEPCSEKPLLSRTVLVNYTAEPETPPRSPMFGSGTWCNCCLPASPSQSPSQPGVGEHADSWTLPGGHIRPYYFSCWNRELALYELPQL